MHPKVEHKIRKEFELMKTNKKQFVEDLISLTKEFEEKLKQEETKNAI